jgi:hypothetical protein
MADSLARVIPRSFYTSGKTALAGEERSKVEQEARAEEAADFIPGGFEIEEEAPQFKRGGPVYTLAEQDLLRRYASR